MQITCRRSSDISDVHQSGPRRVFSGISLQIFEKTKRMQTPTASTKVAFRRFKSTGNASRAVDDVIRRCCHSHRQVLLVRCKYFFLLRAFIQNVRVRFRPHAAKRINTSDVIGKRPNTHSWADQLNPKLDWIYRYKRIYTNESREASRVLWAMAIRYTFRITD